MRAYLFMLILLNTITAAIIKYFIMIYYFHEIPFYCIFVVNIINRHGKF